MRPPTLVLLAIAPLVAGWGCSPPDTDVAGEAHTGAETRPGQSAAGPVLGPVEGHELPPAALDRIQDGDVAPDFTLEAYDGLPVTLSDFRGEKNVVLTFYRGHW